MVRNPDGKVDSVRRVIGKVGAPSTFLPRIYNYIVEEETGVDVCESGKFIKIDKKMLTRSQLKSQLQKELRLNNDGIPAEELNSKVEKQYNSILRSSQMYFTAVPKCSFGCCVSMLGQQGGFLTYQTREGHHVNQVSNVYLNYLSNLFTAKKVPTEP
ncbi:hypothetical protein E3Q23_03945 [Wallemia mellicola]|uniref:Uncharacterized protein n=1 Tax=Wallemia mellicola TaxID=1708541 RepID=A0A4T0RGZ1_9BASI|nr:hypothetical protein E3Q24_04161 [Wallemia mellicola]TIB71023.1 hypothetical protein E3Q23_03945 [Wallemia mellicola]TIB95678.1 hypothetical protein E3Q17_04195 [Wallemia mellicola]TIC37382.1 hypothetical protein E3Q08_04024 [Wallemia mellicola]TIC38770.1 hypothetical protein E3Q07_03706 [Wallemia mellicola]